MTSITKVLSGDTELPQQPKAIGAKARIKETFSKISDKYLSHKPGNASGGLFITKAQPASAGYAKASGLSRAGHATLGIIKAGIVLGTVGAAIYFLGVPLAIPVLGASIVGLMGLGAMQMHMKLSKNKQEKALAMMFAVPFGIIGAPMQVLKKLLESAYADLSLAATGRARKFSELPKDIHGAHTKIHPKPQDKTI